MKAIREALRLRYRLLPYWYTLFYNAEQSGEPVMKPLWVDFPAEKATFKIESDHLVGSAILAHPVTDSGSAGVSVYLPGQGEIWYNAETFLPQKGGRVSYVPVDIFKIPFFYRGGFIIPTHERIRRASILSAEDPYTLIVALNAQGEASGDLYHDDFYSFHYKSGEFVHRQFNFSNGQLISRNLNPKGRFNSDVWLERVVVLGVDKQPQQASLTVNGLQSPVQLETTYNTETKLLVIRKPAVKIVNDFEITLT